MIGREEAKMSKISRRQFVKKAVVTGTAIAAFPYVFIRNANAVWEPRTIVHPNVDNLRVVGIADPKMVLPDASISKCDQFIVKDVVWDNIDKLACSLAQTRNPKEAWKTIFIKPPRRSWSDTVVAIKTNSTGSYKHSSAVISKICHSLIDTLGVRSTNIHIYDGVHGYLMKSFVGLPEGCRVEKMWSRIRTETTVPEPWTKLEGKTRSLKQLVDGSIDILINIAKCRRHYFYWLGRYTMAMKNHFGSFTPEHGHKADGSGLDYLISINKTSEILGSIDKKTGKVLFPRQQLCLIDGLWTSKGSQSREINFQTNFLAMGVLSPVVDYQVATKFRAERMGLKVNMKATQRMLTAFGYNESDLPEGGRIIEA
jgi:hypothetical protein